MVKKFPKPKKEDTLLKTVIDASKINKDGAKDTKIRVIGVGGGGSSIVSEIASKLKKASFVAVNTDSQALKEVNPRVKRFQFGESITHGLGTGMNPELAETAALNEKEKIKKILEGQDLVIIIACLGGGAGSGAAQVFAKISRSLGNLTYGIFTLPFNFEGEKKAEIAKKALERIKPRLNALTIIPNERIFQIVDKNTPLRSALSTINKSLSESLQGLIEIIYEPGLINIDFADLRTILEGQGRLVYLNTVVVPRREDAVKEAMDKALNSPLYPYGIKGARGALFNIAGEKELSLAEVAQISKNISDLLNKEAKIIFGISQGKKYENIIKTTLLVTGCAMKTAFVSTPHKKIIKKRTPKPKLKPQQLPQKNKKPKAQTKKKNNSSKKRKKSRKENPPEESKNKKIEESTAQTESAKPLEGALIGDFKIRKNALQIKKDTEKIEEEMLEKEKAWETPAFLRKRFFT